MLRSLVGETIDNSKWPDVGTCSRRSRVGGLKTLISSYSKMAAEAVTRQKP